ncbi:MAG: N-acetyltransferase [Prevotellaceae bacterium]|nr:N-acetyltransferase [Prevotella sp.]MDD7529861.1 N-acetyltransferase [Prevotellaceae bacterium]MDY2634495.1 N-acetyltransferase [Prevotella sp.]
MNTSVEIRRVDSKSSLKTFIDFQYDLYKDNPYFVPKLFRDEMDTLHKERNAAFEFCDAEYYMAYKDNRLVGRVAAIINHKANNKWGRKMVRFGWFDFIDDKEVSGALLAKVEEYGRQKGMTEIVGPLGFTDLDCEGMLTDGFDQIGTLATSYNYEYYPKHIDAMAGFEKDNDYLEFKIYIPEGIPERLIKLSSMIQDRYNLHVKKVTKKEVFEGGYGKKIFNIINDTFKDLYGYSELSDKQIDQYIKAYFPLIDLNLVTLIEDRNHDNKLVGVAITLPSMSYALQKCRRGRLFPFGWYHILQAIKCHKTNMVDLLLLGILPEYRPKGANALMFSDLIPRYIDYGFEWAESQVEMETNKGVQSQWQFFKTENHKKRRCYKKTI